MKMRKKKNMLIGILCCALVFMGIGYAVLSQVLNITSTANVTGSFNIIIDDIESVPTRTSGATSANERAPKDTTASYEVTFYKPGDYITYDVTVKNLGSIKGVLKSVEVTQTADQEMQNMLDNKDLTIEDVFETKVYETDTTTDIALNQVLDTEGVYNFDIRTTLKDIDFIPNGTMRTKIEVIYAQEGNKSSDTPGEEVVDDYTGPDIEVNAEGLLTRINIDKYTEDGWLKLPAETPDGQPIKSIDRNSFLGYNTIIFRDVNKAMGIETSGYIIYDEEHFDEIKEIIMQTIKDEEGPESITRNIQFFKRSERGFSSEAEIEPINVNIDDKEMVRKSQSSVERLDLRGATNLTTIKSAAFCDSMLSEIYFSDSISSIENYAFGSTLISGRLTLPVSLEYIGEGAFAGNQITHLELPSSVTTIGEGAFANNQINGELDLSDLSDLTIVSGFSGNQITSIKLPEGVTTIAADAFNQNLIGAVLDLSYLTNLISVSGFCDNQITNVNLPSNITEIGVSAFGGNQITHLEIPPSVTTIANTAFYNNAINQLIIPNSVTSIGLWAFCMNPLTAITIKRTQQDFNENVNLSFMGWYSGSPTIEYQTNLES